MNIENMIKSVYDAGYSDRQIENDFDPMASYTVIAAIIEMKKISSTALEILNLFKDYYPNDEYIRIAGELAATLTAGTDS